MEQLKLSLADEMNVKKLINEAFELGRKCGNSYGVKSGIGGYKDKLQKILEKAAEIGKAMP